MALLIAIALKYSMEMLLLFLQKAILLHSVSVRMPAYYEIKRDSLNSLINFAGGLNRNAQNQVYIYRHNAPNEYVDIDIDSEIFI